MLQVKKRSDSSNGWRIMATLCFYQDSRHNCPMYWIKRELGIGYISKRNDGITELRINGYRQIANILKKLLPYIKFKKKQAKLILRSIKFVEKDIEKFNKQDYQELTKLILAVQESNYQSPHKKTKQDLLKIFGLTP